MLRNYLKIAFRNLVRNKVYSFINICGIVVGILGSIIIFQLVKYHLSTDTYHKKAKNIYRVVMNLHLDDGSIEHEKGSPFILHQTLKNDFPSVEKVAYVGQQEMTISVPKQNRVTDRFLEKEAAAFIAGAYFDIFDYQWLSGSPSQLDVPNTVVLTEKYAKKYFGNVNPVGKILKINNVQNVKVVGVLRNITENTDLKTQLFVSLPTIKSIIPDNSYDEWSWFIKSRETYVLLKENTSKQILEAQFPAFANRYFSEGMGKYYHFHLQELSDIHFNLDYGGKIKKSTIYLFSIIGILLIIIACINFINLSTAQSFKRFKEIGVRKTFGSSQLQLFWQFITEAAFIVISSVVLALLMSNFIMPIVNNRLNLQITSAQFFDGKTLIFIFSLIVFTIILAGFYPSFIVSRYNPLNALKGIYKGTREGFSLRKTLVITQFSIAFVLIAVSILIVLQVNFILNKDIGIAKNLILHVKLPDNEANHLSVLKNQLAQKPNINIVSFERGAPSSKGGWGGSIKYENRDWEKFVARSRCADENYLATYQIKLVAGRNLIASDTINEVLINQKLAKDLGLKNPEEAINKRLVVGDASEGKAIIIGVVADFNNSDLYTGVEPTVIFCTRSRYRQAAISLNSFDANKTINELSKIWESIYPNDVFEYTFYDKELAQFYEREILTRNIIICFSILSIFISCLGLFGLVSFTVSQKTKEIGIRKVLGASVSQIVTLLSKDFLKLVLIAFVIAVPVAWYAMHRWLQDFAYRIDISWWIFALAGVLALLIALLTVSFQAIKAALANPVKSLRTE
jgi:putative ABC transport system permease protein